MNRVPSRESGGPGTRANSRERSIGRENRQHTLSLRGPGEAQSRSVSRGHSVDKVNSLLHISRDSVFT